MGGMPVKKHLLQGALLALSLSLISVALPGVAAADIYKYVDETGVIHLTNVPTDVTRKYTLLMREPRILFNRNIARDIKKYDPFIAKSAAKHGMDPALIKAVIKAESNFNHQAVSPKGARGLMQLMPATASSLHVEDSFHPEKNIDGGVRYLRYLIQLFNGDLRLALAAYNAGEKAVQRYGGIPPYRETQQYVQRVLAYLEGYRK
jgi:soluble lytic murein transglycosylase-like protein